VKRVISRLVAAALLSVALVACQNHPAQVAPGFKRDKVAQVRVGLSLEDLSRTLGSPLARHPEDPKAIDVKFVYATRGEWTTPGGGWQLLSGKAPTCIITVSGGAVVEVFVSTGRTLCTCTRMACPETWLDSCASGVPE
jgi:hypothetical protein